MAKAAFPAMLLLLLLHIGCAGAGVEEACKKASDAKFCATLLQAQAQASELAEKEPVKTGLAAMNATLGRVDELREFMVRQAVQEQTTPEELAALSGCLCNVGEAEGGVKVALQTLNETNGAERDELLKMINGAAAELTTCLASLKTHTSPPLREAVRLTDDSVQACSVARSLLP